VARRHLEAWRHDDGVARVRLLLPRLVEHLALRVGHEELEVVGAEVVDVHDRLGVVVVAGICRSRSILSESAQKLGGPLDAERQQQAQPACVVP
jgi:hypothetical protein